MRLLRTRTLHLEPFDDPRTRPRYAVLSHVWAPGHLSYSDLTADADRPGAGPGSEIIHRGCHVAEQLGYEYIWIESVCVDVFSAEEVSEAVNSAFRWFQEATACLVYLADLTPGSPDDETSWSHCEWWTRAWTLPELLAPSDVQFYDGDWNFRGTKTSPPLLGIISRITHISEDVLCDASLIPHVSVAKRMSWAATRNARHIEDRAYSLLGIFGVHMQAVYGEGTASFVRLQEEILRDTQDMSLLAWEAQPDDKRPFRGLLASSPGEFARFVQCPPQWRRPLSFEGEVQSSNRGLSITAPFISYPGQGQQVLLLDLGAQHVPQTKTVLVLFRHNDYYVRAASKPSVISTEPGTSITREISAAKDLDTLTSHAMADTLQLPMLAKGHLTLPPAETVWQLPAASLPLREPIATAAFAQRSGKRSTAESSEIYVLSRAATSLSMSPMLSSLKRSLPPHVTPDREDKRARTRDPLVSQSGSDRTELPGGRSCAGSESGQEDLSDDGAPGPPPVLDGDHPFLAVADELTETAREEFAVWQKSRAPQSGSYLACPFQAHDRDRHAACLKAAALRSPRDVKAHVWKAHRLPHYCPVCYALFETAPLKNEHIVRRDCELRPKPRLEGVSGDQKQSLAKKDGGSREEQWRAIWDVIFPDQSPPSPFPEGEDGRRISLAREFWDERGQLVVSGFLEAKGLLGYEVRDEERGLAALYALVLERLVETIFEEERWEDVDAVPAALPPLGSLMSGLLPSASVSTLGAVLMPQRFFRGADGPGLPVRRRGPSRSPGQRLAPASGRGEIRSIRLHAAADGPFEKARCP